MCEIVDFTSYSGLWYVMCSHVVCVQEFTCVIHETLLIDAPEKNVIFLKTCVDCEKLASRRMLKKAQSGRCGHFSDGTKIENYVTRTAICKNYQLDDCIAKKLHDWPYPIWSYIFELSNLL